MRRITAALAALAVTTGVLLATTATPSAQAEGWPAGHCIGSSLAMFATTGLCVLPRNFPVLTSPAT
ncbi:hypothetical protein [Amycolatopsis rifamycinica]|uniref:Uncharacterized protein n=1 Tax=Amycolatopsis rifamycinica TaxID=287986 RepID=A0A066U3B0_9PSEU|nr:hypothetical protein [Amycolatopsis rifamycinica]KDN21956.1 hypothetical protein DV20_11235 [Amycolatopsis rifamycinica]